MSPQISPNLPRSQPAYSGLTQVLQPLRLEPSEIQLSAEQVELAKKNVFSQQDFFVQRVEQSVVGTIFRGNLRGEPAKVVDDLRAKLRGTAGLEGVRLLLTEDPLLATFDEIQVGHV